MRPADKQPLFASYQGMVTVKAVESRCCIFSTHWLDKVGSLNTSDYCRTDWLTIMDVIYVYLCVDRIKGSVGDVAVLPKV